MVKLTQKNIIQFFAFFVLITVALIEQYRSSKSLFDDSNYRLLNRELKAEKILHAKIDRYPGLTNEKPYDYVDPYGWVQVIFHGRSFGMISSVTGLEIACVDCDFHIHSGSSCDDDSMVGGHFWNKELLDSDPWIDNKAGKYTATLHTSTHGHLSSGIYTGYTYPDHIGRVVVFHGSDGTKIACGVLKVQKGPSPVEETSKPNSLK